MANLNPNSLNQITKESIFTALMLLMEKKAFKEITITEIAKKAGVSRMAFYRNYEVKEDIITEYIEDFYEEYANEIKDLRKEDDYKKLLIYFSTFRKHGRLITNLINSNMINMLLEKSLEALHKLSEETNCNKPYSPEQQKYWVELVAGGLFNIVLEWARNGMTESDEFMAKMVSSLIRD